jgi:hypothetical protein
VKRVFRNAVVYSKSRIPGPPEPKEPDETYEYIKDGHRIVHGPKHPDIYCADLAFLLTMKRWPNSRIEHINGDTLDCRWANLRESGEGRPRSFDLPGWED